MLANKAKLAYKTTGSTFIELSGLKEIPEMGEDVEKVENSSLDASVKTYEKGVGDAPELAYKFKYNNNAKDSPYRVLRKFADDGTTVDFKETLVDGTTTTFSGQVSIKRTGGALNDVLEFTMTVLLSTALTITDPVIA